MLQLQPTSNIKNFTLRKNTAKLQKFLTFFHKNLQTYMSTFYFYHVPSELVNLTLGLTSCLLN